MSSSNVFIVSNRLPIRVGGDGNVSVTTGGLASALSGVDVPGAKLTWVGWNGCELDSPEKEETIRQQIRSATTSKYHFEPVFLTAEQEHNYYDGFSNGSLWPILHYFTGLARFNENWYSHYYEVNKVFCDVIAKVVSPKDLVWVHDYHLMLLPQMLRERIPDLRIGFFLHVPFPSYEVFRCIPQRKDLLEGLLGADLLGFHTFAYVRHFKSSVLRCLGLEASFDTIRHDGRIIKLGIHPIGINWREYKEALLSTEYQESIQEYARDFASRKLVLSVSRLDYTKGILAMLDAIEFYLEHFPTKDITFLLIAVPSRDNVQSYADLKERLVKRVGELNGKYSQISTTPPIQFIYYSVNMNKLAALYSVADVALVLPLIDGMNLVAKEFIAIQPCEKEACNPLQKPGCLVLSEFAGASSELYDALIVNPHDTRGVAEAIEKALKMEYKERIIMNKQMRERVRSQDADFWAKNFLKELDALTSDDSALDKCRKFSTAVVDDVVGKFRVGSEGRKALFLDYDGTLVPIKPLPEMAVPTKKLLHVLNALAARSDLDVFLVSGRRSDFMDKHFAAYSDPENGHNLWLVAEHGYMIKAPGSEWRNVTTHLVVDWKEEIKKVLQIYVLDTPGSFIEEKHSALVWHYRKSDLELGHQRSADLVGQLSEFVHNLPVEIHHGKKIVEIRSIDIGKGRVVEKFLHESNYSWAICFGDDTTDENMFKVVSDKLIKVKVGSGETSASYRCKSPDNVVDFLEKISV